MSGPANGKVLVAMPPAMLQQIDFVARTEHRTRSDLIREALRRYLNNFEHDNRLTQVHERIASNGVGA